VLRPDLLARLGRRQPTGTIIGFDRDIRYQSENYWITRRGSYIHEHQRLDATFLNGGSANLTNELNTLRLQTIFQHLGHAAYDPLQRACARVRHQQRRLDCRDCL
jgi:hypothetical protein